MVQTGPIPRVRPSGMPSIMGSLERDIVRRVVLRNLNQIRFCYERRLAANPSLAGELRLQFVISPSGNVQASRIESSTLADEQVGACVAAAARRRAFPAPEDGGIVTVSFPFRFDAGEGPAGPWPVVRTPGWHGLFAPPVRVATIQEGRRGATGLPGASQAVLREIAELRAKLAAEPDRRKHHRELARLFARIGELDEGAATVRAWLARDALDPEALTLLADVTARQGDPSRAVRTLASVVEVLPGDKSAHERMARLYERAGRLEDACAHRVTLAALSPADEAAAAAATRCETTGAGPEPEPIRGDLVASATFEGGVDVDVAVVLRDGTRVSWMGGKANVRARSATSLSAEELAVGFLPLGTHTLEVTRASAAGAPPVRGTIDLRVLGERRRIPFTLDGARVTVATLTVSNGGLGALRGLVGGGGQ